MKTYYDESIEFYYKHGKEAYDMYVNAPTLAIEPYMENHGVALDIAGANGSYSLALKKKYPNISFICIDFLDNALKAGEMLSHDLNLPMRFKKATADDIPLEDESVDYIIVRKALHLFDPLDKCIGELYRVLKPGGKVFIIKHINFPAYPLYHFLKQGNTDFIRRTGSYVHLKHWLSSRKAVCIFKSAGFYKVSIVPTDFMLKNISNIKLSFIKKMLAPYAVKPFIIAYK